MAKMKFFNGSTFEELDAKNADKVNGHTVLSDVPKNAKFTDTIYNDSEVKKQLSEKATKTEVQNAQNAANNANSKATTAQNSANSAQSTASTALSKANEAFQFANNGKTLISNVVGSPLLATDTFQQQKEKIQNLKNTFASNLSSKGQNSIGTENLNNLIEKISNINTGKKWAKGKLKLEQKKSSSSLEFNITTNLAFEPSIYIAYVVGRAGGNRGYDWNEINEFMVFNDNTGMYFNYYQSCLDLNQDMRIELNKISRKGFTLEIRRLKDDDVFLYPEQGSSSDELTLRWIALE